MSVKAIGWAWDLDLPPVDKYVLIAYVDHADHEGKNIRPSKALIAWKTGYTQRAIQEITARLVKAELLIEVSKEPGKVIRYEANLEGGIKQASRKKGRTSFTPEPASPLNTVQGQGRTGFGSGDEPPVPKLVVNPSLEPSDEPSTLRARESLRLNPEETQEPETPDTDTNQGDNSSPQLGYSKAAQLRGGKEKKSRSSLGSKQKKDFTRKRSDWEDESDIVPDRTSFSRSAAPVRRLTAPIPQQPQRTPQDAPTRQNGANSPLETYIAGIAGFEITAPVAELLRQPMTNGDVPIKLFDEHAPYAKWVKQVAEAYETASGEKNFKMRTDTLATRISQWDKFSEWASENDEVKVDNRPKRSSVKDQLDWLLKYNRLSQEEYDESVGKLHEFPE